MKFELFLFGITGFLIYNTYHDNKFTNLFKLNKKYIQIIMYGIGALSIYTIYKKSPEKGVKFLHNANNFIQNMSIDKETSNLITPLLNLTSANSYDNNIANIYNNSNNITPQFKRMLNSTGKTSKRCVSESKKKYVASSQQWKCASCNNNLDHTFEVDHITDLQYGGDNSISNLEALCRNCHGKKTFNSRL
jgi:hypothetical protein